MHCGDTFPDSLCGGGGGNCGIVNQQPNYFSASRQSYVKSIA
jgi:hypothetical protein